MTSDAEQAHAILLSKGVTEPVESAFVAGAGFASVADGLDRPIIVPYRDLPGFPVGPFNGQEGRLLIGTQEGARVAYLQGCSQFYEEANSRGMAVPLETLSRIGVQSLLLMGGAGSVRADLYPGTLVAITDHINLNGFNPLIGTSEEGNQISLIDAYDPRLLKRLKRSGTAGGVTLHEGVFMWFSGPSLETAAEIKMARVLGADLVGTSIVPEVIIARRLGIKLSAVAVITHFGTGLSSGNPSQLQNKDFAIQGAVGLRRLIRAFLKTKEQAFTL